MRGTASVPAMADCSHRGAFEPCHHRTFRIAAAGFFLVAGTRLHRRERLLVLVTLEKARCTVCDCDACMQRGNHGNNAEGAERWSRRSSSSLGSAWNQSVKCST
jgi:hypothetical protein